MAKMTRQGFITKTSAGAVALGALVALPGLPHSEAAGRPTPQGTGMDAELHQPLMLHVRNAATGEVALLVGTREIVYHDRALVRRLVQATR